MKSHKITEPYAQIPTFFFGITFLTIYNITSQNNRALRSNPNGCKIGSKRIRSFQPCHKITEPYAQIPTLLLAAMPAGAELQNVTK